MICISGVKRMNARRVLGLLQQSPTEITVELTADSGSSIALITDKVDSGVFSLSIILPRSQD